MRMVGDAVGVDFLLAALTVYIIPYMRTHR